jgi:hypothetical protein
MIYLVDGNVLSEPTKPTPHPKALAWLSAHETDFGVDAVILGEGKERGKQLIVLLIYGIEPGRPGDYSPGLPQIRTCPTKAYGSSSQGLAA